MSQLHSQIMRGLCACLLTLLMGGGVHGALLFEEDFNTGAIDEVKWDVYGAQIGRTTVEEINPGDYALKMGDYWTEWQAGVTAKQAFPRGNNIRCTWTAWHDASGSQNPATAFFGPWHQEPVDTGWRKPEAMLGLNWSFFDWQEDNFEDQNIIVYPLWADWPTAFGKDHAMKFRVWLGDATGSMFEYSKDGGSTWIPGIVTRRNVWDVSWPLDTRGKPAGSRYPADWPVQSGAIRVGSHSPNYVSFWAAAGMDFGPNVHLFIDDIKVEDDTTSSTPVNAAGNAWQLLQ